MSFVTFVSGRYLRTRQKRAFISLITVLSIAGVTVGVMALIVVIAVMAGFETDLKSRIMGIRPHLVITKNQGRFTDYNQVLQKVESIAGIEKASAYITTQVVLRTTTRAAGAILKGIDAVRGDSGITGVDSSRLVNPAAAKDAPRKNKILPGIILGKELAANLGVIRGDTVYIISPRGMLSPAGHIPAMIKFQVVDRFESGMYEFDGTLLFVDLIQAQKMLRMPASVSGLEIRLKDMDQVQEISTVLEPILGHDYTIENWKQINRNLFSALRLEKTVMFHHPGPDRPRGRIQYCRIPGHDGHGKTKRYRHSQNHGGNGQVHQAYLCHQRADDRIGGNGAGNIGGGGGMHPAETLFLYPSPR